MADDVDTYSGEILQKMMERFLEDRPVHAVRQAGLDLQSALLDHIILVINSLDFVLLSTS